MKFDLSSYYVDKVLYVSNEYRDKIEEVKSYFGVGDVGIYNSLDEFVL